MNRNFNYNYYPNMDRDMNNPKYSNMYYLNFVDKVVGMYTNS